MRLITLTIFILTISILAFAQERVSVTGNVVNSVNNNGTGTPAEGVKVTLTSVNDPAMKYETVTDADGKFMLDGIPTGRYRLFGFDARQDSSFTINEVVINSAENPNNFSNIQLNSTPGPACVNCGIREYVTVAAGEDQLPSAVSKTYDVITGKQMRDRADFTMIDSLRTIPGFRVQQLGGFGKTASIKTRGLRNQDTAILIDGVRYRDPTAINGDASSFLSDITLTSVSEIEIMRGPGSSIYGTNAIGGVVDLQTPTARAGTHGNISGAFGNLGLGRFRGNISHGSDDGKYGFVGAVSRTAYTKGIDGDDNASNTNLQGRFDIRPINRTTITGSIFYTNARVRLNSSPDTLGILPSSNSTIIDAIPNVNFISDADDPDSLQWSHSFSGRIGFTHTVNEWMVLSGLYNGFSSKRTNDNGILGAGYQSASNSRYDGRIDTANIKAVFTPAKDNILTAGYEFEREKYRNDGSTPDATGNYFTGAGQRSKTFFIQDLAGFMHGRLQLAGGLRVQKFTLSPAEFSITNAPYTALLLTSPPTAFTADGAASYLFPRSKTKLRVHVGNGYRIPSLYERFGSFFSNYGTPSFTAIGDPYLKPERSIAFDGGVDQGVYKDKLSISAIYFYTKLTDVIGYGNVVPNIGTTVRPYGGYLNQKGGTARGGELSLRGRITATTDIFASYTYTNSDQRQPQVTGSGVVSSMGIPDHQFSLTANQKIGRLWLNFDLSASSDYLAPLFSSSTYSTYIYRFKGNRRGDLTAGYVFGWSGDRRTLRLFGTIENIFDNEYFENGFKTSGIAPRIGIAFGF